MAKPTTVDEYVASFPEPAQSMLRDLRALGRSHAPDAEEGLKWNQPAYSMRTILFTFCGYSKHANFVFTPSTLQAFLSELHGYDTGKGSIKIPYDGEIPEEVIGRMIEFRIRECEDDGVNWM